MDEPKEQNNLIRDYILANIYLFLPGPILIFLSWILSVVLFKFLSRYSDTDKITFEDQAEQVALWNLLCLLESTLVEPFQENYLQIIQKARDNIRHEE